jgi:hypothetical protein
VKERSFTESVVEEAALAWLEGLGYAVLHGPDIAAGEPFGCGSIPTFRPTRWTTPTASSHARTHRRSWSVTEPCTGCW